MPEPRQRHWRWLAAAEVGARSRDDALQAILCRVAVGHKTVFTDNDSISIVGDGRHPLDAVPATEQGDAIHTVAAHRAVHFRHAGEGWVGPNSTPSPGPAGVRLID